MEIGSLKPIPGPSPLQQVATRPLSQAPASELVMDPHFWKKLNIAKQNTETKVDEEEGAPKSSRSVSMKYGWVFETPTQSLTMESWLTCDY